MKEKFLLISVEGLEKVEILQGLGFDVSETGNLRLNGENVTSVDGTERVRVEDVKAIVPGSLAVVTDLSEMEPLFS